MNLCLELRNWLPGPQASSLSRYRRGFRANSFGERKLESAIETY